MDYELRPGERLEPLFGPFSILQKEKGVRFGTDAVLLSAFAQSRGAKKAADLGCGGGIIPLLLCARGGAEHVTGVELQEPYADMATRSAAICGLSDRITILSADLRRLEPLLPAASMELVTSNPPYVPRGAGQRSPMDERNIARSEVCCTLPELTASAARLLIPGGSFCLVHRPARLPELLSTLTGAGIAPVRLRLIHPAADKPASLLLLEGRRGVRGTFVVGPPLILYEKDGSPTRELLEAYDGGAL